MPTFIPTHIPTSNPTIEPTINLSNPPTLEPTVQPTASSTKDPTTSLPTEDQYPTEIAGCCAGDSRQTTQRCMKIDSARSCTKRSACHWIETSDASDCEWKDTSVPTDPGCCVAVDSEYENDCKDYYSDSDCFGHLCYWTPAGDNFDCSKLWSQPTGCCKSASGKMNERCESLATESSCDRKTAKSDVCHVMYVFNMEFPLYSISSICKCSIKKLAEHQNPNCKFIGLQIE